MSNQYRLREKFSYQVTHWIVEEKTLFGWKNVWKEYSLACGARSHNSFTYETAKKKLEYLVQYDERAAHFYEKALGAETFRPRILYPPLPDEEPSSL
jgi:hypothetical protein